MISTLPCQLPKEIRRRLGGTITWIVLSSLASLNMVLGLFVIEFTIYIFLGYEKYLQMYDDPLLCFRSRVGRPQLTGKKAVAG